MTRFRSRGPTYILGSGTKNTVPFDRSELISHDLSEDVDNVPGIDHPLYLNTMKNSGLWNGHAFWRDAWDLPLIHSVHPGHPSHPSLDFNALAANLGARTNPTRASVSIPLFVFELKDVPRMVKQAIRHGIDKEPFSVKDRSGDNLAFQFGWKPLVNDLKKIIQFQTSVNNKVKELENLAKNGGLRRRRSLGTSSIEEDLGTPVMESHLFFATARKTMNSTRDTWGTIRWHPQIGALPSSTDDRLDLARSLANGTHSVSQLSNVWNAMPWSWLIDWFSNVNDFIEGGQNSITYSSNINIMWKTESIIKYTDFSGVPSWASLSPPSPTSTVETKNRTQPVAVVPAASVPFLSVRQLSILGSMAIQKRGSYKS